MLSNCHKSGCERSCPFKPAVDEKPTRMTIVLRLEDGLVGGSTWHLGDPAKVPGKTLACLHFLNEGLPPIIARVYQAPLNDRDMARSAMRFCAHHRTPLHFSYWLPEVVNGEFPLAAKFTGDPLGFCSMTSGVHSIPA